MKFFHISDLHIGKQLNFYNLAENQAQILTQIVEKTVEYRPDAILIAGDIYDRSVPSAEAYTLFDNFLTQLSMISPAVTVIIIAGNHDSAERLNYAGTFLAHHNIHISVMPPQTGEEYLKKVTMQDEHGDVDFYLLPFTKPAFVRHLFDEGATVTYDSAVRMILDRENIDFERRNVILAHQFFISGQKQPETCESEQVYISVGGIDSVETDIIRPFDYAALGHIHGPQSIGEKHIRYCGTPLKYSVSEEKHQKSITMVTMGSKDEDIKIDTIPLEAVQDVRREKGKLKDIIAKASEGGTHDFISVTLTDEEELYKPKEQLDEVYDHILEVRTENSRTRAILEEMHGEASVLDPMEAFRLFNMEMNGMEMNEKEEQIMAGVIEKAGQQEN